jgi:hypothetical protein
VGFFFHLIISFIIFHSILVATNATPNKMSTSQPQRRGTREEWDGPHNGHPATLTSFHKSIPPITQVFLH